MPKPVTGQEGNLRKPVASCQLPVARQELNLGKRIMKTAGKRVARENGKQVAGGMTTGRMAKRKTKLLKAMEVSVDGDATEKLNQKEKEGQDLLSCSENDDLRVMFDEWAKKHKKDLYLCLSKKEIEERFKIFRASKKLVDEHNSLIPGSTLGLNYFADSHFQCGGLKEEESEELKEAKGQDILSCSENDQLLRAKFDQWAKKIGKTYSSETEREERFQIFCASKKLVDEHNSLNLGYKLDLHWFSDMEVQCGVAHVYCTGTSEEESEELKEAEENLDRLKCSLPTLFDKWQKKYGIKYSSKKERNERFQYFCATKKRIDYCKSVSSCRYGFTEYADRPRLCRSRKHRSKYDRSCA